MSGTNGVAVVTGASRGIGREIALKLAEDGYDIAFCFQHNADAAGEVADAIQARDKRVFQRQCDVSDAPAVQAFLGQCEEALGPVRVLVNCAGIVRDSPLVLMGQRAWSDVIDTNLTGTFNFCRNVGFGLMKRRRGAVVNISSVVGVHGNAGQTNYAAAKAGIIGFSKALAKELAAYSVRVNVVAPGYIVTDMTNDLDAKIQERIRKAIALGSFGEPRDVAETVSFLVSDRARYITGQTIQVDGGITL